MSKSYLLGRDSLTALWELLISKEVRSQKYAISNLHVECTHVWKSWLIATICTDNEGVIEYPLLGTYTLISIENFLKIQVLPLCRARLLGAVNAHRLCGPYVVGWFWTDNDFPQPVTELTYCVRNKSYTLGGIHSHAVPNQPAICNRQPFFQWEKEMNVTIKILSVL